MTRRELLLVLGAAMTAGHALRAQQKAMPMICFLRNMAQTLPPSAIRPGICAGINDLRCAIRAVRLKARNRIGHRLRVAVTTKAVTHTGLRVGDPSFFVPVLLGMLVWAGIYLRDQRLHELAEIREEALIVIDGFDEGARGRGLSFFTQKDS